MKNYQSQSQNTARKKNARALHPISGVLNSIMKSLGISKNYNGWLVVSHWPQIVGEQIAKVTCAERYDDGILYVAVANDAWRQELTMQIETILEEIRRLPYGKAIKQVRLVGGRKGQ